MYRDDLEAAHARIDALEHELAQTRRKLDAKPVVRYELPPPRPATFNVPVETPSHESDLSLLGRVAIWLIFVTVAFASTCDHLAHHHRHATSTSVLIDCEMKHCS